MSSNALESTLTSSVGNHTSNALNMHSSDIYVSASKAAQPGAYGRRASQTQCDVIVPAQEMEQLETKESVHEQDTLEDESGSTSKLGTTFCTTLGSSLGSTLDSTLGENLESSLGDTLVSSLDLAFEESLGS